MAVQAVVVATLLGLALWRAGERSDLRLLVVGIGVMTFALIALGAAH